MNDDTKELIKRLSQHVKARAIANDLDPTELIETEVANFLEAQAAKIEELEFDNASLLAELGNIQTHTDQTIEALRRAYARKK